MNMLKLCFVAMVIACQMITGPLYGQDTKWSPKHVYYGSGGKLAYTPDEKGNIIPDFSHVGYMYGDEPIPDVPVVIEINPVEGDDGANIQAAIDQVSAMSPDDKGFRGTVLLKKGTYQVKGQLFIRSGGIVLRGEGQTDEGTVVIADGTGKREFIVIGNGNGRKIDSSSKTNIVEGYVPVGRKFVVVGDASRYNQGDHIAIYRPGTANWISDLKMVEIGWTPSSYSFYFERLVTKVSGDTIFFRNPVVMAMDANYGGGFVYKGYSDRIEKVGVEDLCLKSAYRSASDEDHAWEAVVFNSIEHGWARRVTSWYFGYSCVSVKGPARLITVENCNSRDPKSLLAGGRRYSFNISGSLSLVKNCTTTNGRHDFVNGSRVCGPNVFTNCTATNPSTDAGPHHRWAMGTLWDVLEYDGPINVQDRATSGSGHGWAGANQVLWNCTAITSAVQNPWVSANNYNFGFTGEKWPGRYSRPDGVWVGLNRPGIFPESLYQAQLESRLNDVRIFSAYGELEKVNDSSFVMSFNMSIDSSLADAKNFFVGGDAGYAGAEFSLTALSDTSIMLVFDGIGILTAYTSVVVNVDNMISSSGKPLEGMSFATYVEPDLTPVVRGEMVTVNNENEYLEASSSRSGSIYLVKYTGDYNYRDLYKTVDDLERAVSENLGRKIDAPDANTPVSIPVDGLSGGYYLYFSVDKEGRMSEPAYEWPQVLETGPVTGIDNELTMPGFSVWSSNESIFIQTNNASVKYSVKLFDITGKLFCVRESLAGDQQFVFPDYHGIFIVHLISENGLNLETHKLLFAPSR